VCRALDQCHEVGVCDAATGGCSNPEAEDGTACDDGDVCSDGDLCLAGQCVGEQMPDSDADGLCDPEDLCPDFPDPDQMDLDGDGIGDMCQCTAPAPGRCLSGGGAKRTDCLLEFAPSGPVTLNGRGTMVKNLLRCTDGDPACDMDGVRDGQCTFGVALCFGSSDPRFAACNPSMVANVEVVKPNPARTLSISGRANAEQLEGAVSALGLEVRRRGRVVAEATNAMGHNQCSPLIRLAIPAPNKRKPMKQKFQLRAQGTNRKRDKDRFVLMCDPLPPDPSRP
jgi:hypothetical protein